MKSRPITLIMTFAVGAVAAALLVVGTAGAPEALAVADDALAVEDASQPVGVAVEFAHVRDFLGTIPDPKNLFASGKSTPVPFAQGLGIRHFRRERPVPGAIEIVRWDEPVGLFQACVELLPVDAARFVLHRAWHDPEVVIVCVDVEKLRPLDPAALVERAEAIKDGEAFHWIDPSACTEIRVPRDLEPGAHRFGFPDGAHSIPEILLLYPSTRPDADNHMHVMRVEPRAGRVTVVAPHRKAFAEFDDARMSVRLLRDPTTRRVVGDGVRIRPFVLSHDLSRVERWLD